MVLQARDIAALDSLARYFMMSARQVRRVCFPDDSTGRITRRRLLKMMQSGFVRKRAMFVVNPRDGSATPVYHLTKQGREFLVGHFDDSSYRLKPIEPSQPQHLWHYLAVTETHILLNAAIVCGMRLPNETTINTLPRSTGSQPSSSSLLRTC